MEEKRYEYNLMLEKLENRDHFLKHEWGREANTKIDVQ
jgi:hypothetical protein